MPLCTSYFLPQEPLLLYFPFSFPFLYFCSPIHSNIILHCIYRMFGFDKTKATLRGLSSLLLRLLFITFCVKTHLRSNFGAKSASILEPTSSSSA
ncbi:hypothetical protein BDV26DRAFT_273915 [Aspergillus bertholletiae]|uniref:Uncharacterized protein n=1 Tax=Aspergillus bertholletiae TaxID=1226010 RepID=A0A5N7ART5_9EURO|nr:hypothetical protein BDV26DRAFT_273915 [Aspergillus bertholletiae]